MNPQAISCTRSTERCSSLTTTCWITTAPTDSNSCTYYLWSTFQAQNCPGRIKRALCSLCPDDGPVISVSHCTFLQSQIITLPFSFNNLPPKPQSCSQGNHQDLLPNWGWKFSSSFTSFSPAPTVPVQQALTWSYSMSRMLPSHPLDPCVFQMKM